LASSRRITIVGNGAIPEGLAAEIDASDVVVRFNDCRSVGRGGRRTDVVAVCNTGRPALSMLGGGQWKTSDAVRQAREIWGVRDPEKFEAMRAPLAASHPDLDDFCDDYTQGFDSFATATGRRFKVIPAGVHDALDDELAAFAPSSYVVPSSGLVVLADILANVAGADDIVAIAGFGHGGWPWHPFAAERRWVDRHVATGRLTRIDHQNRSPASQGN
jgi:hypothetical protein